MREPLYTPKGLENQLRNLCYTAHDLACGCQNPTKHLEYLFKPEKCHRTEETTTTDGKHTEDAVDGLEDGVLEKIFSEDLQEDDSG